MITSTLVDRGSATAPPVANRLGKCRTKSELIAQCRRRMAAVQRFIDNPAQRQVSLGSLERSEVDTELAKKTGLGTQGIFTAFEPADLALYESLLRSPLQMPRQPQVLLQLVDHNTGQEATRYQESFLYILVNCPGGQDAWYMVSVAVPSEIMCVMGLAWGIPKYLADELSIGDRFAQVVYEGEVRLEGHFRDDEAAASLVGTKPYGVGEVAVRFNPTSFGEPVLVARNFRGIELVERRPGWAKIVLGTNEPLRALLPEHTELPAVWQRYLPGSWELCKL